MNNFYIVGELKTDFFKYQKINIVRIGYNYFLMSANYSSLVANINLKNIIKYCNDNNINIEYLKTYVDYFNKEGQPIDYNGEVINKDTNIYIDIDEGIYIDMFSFGVYQVHFKEFFKYVNTSRFEELLINNKINFKKL